MGTSQQGPATISTEVQIGAQTLWDATFKYRAGPPPDWRIYDLAMALHGAAMVVPCDTDDYYWLIYLRQTAAAIGQAQKQERART